jgi:HSP20 family molecular chaperone IbpA
MSIFPHVNIFAMVGEYFIEADLAGVTRESVEMLVEGNEITIIGRRRRQSSQADLYRNITLPKRLDAAKASSSYRDGILSIVLPHRSGQLPRESS